MVAILKSFQNAKSFQLEGHKLLIFADYLQATHLLSPLAYPAILRLTDQAGETKSSSHPEEAASYLFSYLHIPPDLTPMETN